MTCYSDARNNENHIHEDNIAPSQFQALLIASLPLFGMYLPTSIDGTFSRILAHVGFLVCFALLLLITRTVGLVSLPIYMSFSCVIPLLLIFTYTSGMKGTGLVDVIGYGILALIYAMRLERIRFPEWLVKLCAVVNVLNITMALMILTGSESVDHFIESYYSAFYPELVPNMLLLRKPILTFATHSLAGLFFYLFFYLSFETYKVKRKRIFFVFTLCYLFLMIALLSNSGLFLAAVGIAQILFHFWSTLQNKVIWISVALGTICLLAIFQVVFHVFNTLLDTSTILVEFVESITATPESGLISRWGAGGIFVQGLEYLKQHPFSPIGLGMREGWTPGDIGVMNYLLRGSVILVVVVYGGLLYFLRRTLQSRRDAYLLFAVIVFFELGFSSLTYFRMLYFLPFCVIYLNGLRSSPSLNS